MPTPHTAGCQAWSSSLHALETLRLARISSLVLGPGRPSAQWPCTHHLHRSFQALLGYRELAGSIAHFNPIDENGQHINIRRCTGADVIDTGSHIRSEERRVGKEGGREW